MHRTHHQARRLHHRAVWALLTLALASVGAQAQNARTALLDADAAASVALVRVMARGLGQQAQTTAMASAGVDRLPTLPMMAGTHQPHAVVRHTALRQLVLVPDNVVSCGSQLSIGTVQTDRPILGNVNLQVVVTGSITQVSDGLCR